LSTSFTSIMKNEVASSGERAPLSFLYDNQQITLHYLRSKRKK